jgi:hypothetical protein
MLENGNIEYRLQSGGYDALLVTHPDPIAPLHSSFENFTFNLDSFSSVD